MDSAHYADPMELYLSGRTKEMSLDHNRVENPDTRAYDPGRWPLLSLDLRQPVHAQQ